MARACRGHPPTTRYIYERSGLISAREFHRIWEGTLTAVHPGPGYRIRQPVLLVRGEHDRLDRIAVQASQWAERDRDVTLSVIPGAGHCANMDEATAFNRLLLDFLQRHVPTQAGSRWFGQSNDALPDE